MKNNKCLTFYCYHNCYTKKYICKNIYHHNLLDYINEKKNKILQILCNISYSNQIPNPKLILLVIQMLTKN